MKKIMMSLLSVVLMSLIFMPGALAASKKTVVFGDSNTEGANWDDNHYLNSKKWANKLSLDRPVVNSGVAGNTVGMGKKRMESILKQSPKTVTIMFGTNDGLLRENFIPKTSWRQFEKDLNYMVDTFQSKKINVVLMTAVPVIEEGKGYYYSRHDRKLYEKYGGAREFQDKYNDVTRKVAKQQDVPLVDTYKAFIQYAGDDTDKALVESGLMDKSGTHMSVYGADVLYRAVDQTLERNKY